MRSGKEALSEFLQTTPWPSEWQKREKPVDYLFSIQTSLPLANIWKILSDTSSFNKLLKLPEIHFTEEDGKKYGSYRLMGRLHRWYEVPWEWMYGKYIFNERIYEKGMFHYSRAKYEIRKNDDNTYTIKIYFGWIPKGFLSRAVLVFYKSGFISSFTKVFSMLSEKSGKNTNIEESQSFQLDTSTSQIKFHDKGVSVLSLSVDEYLNDLLINGDGGFYAKTKGDGGVSTARVIVEYALTAPEEKTGYIRSKVLAKDIGKNHQEVLPVMLHLARSGFFHISWEILCPNCRGSKDHLGHLWESPSGSVCDKCNINFKESGYSMLEIAFRINPEIRNVSEQLFCSAEPAKKPMIIMQKKITAGESCACNLSLEEGRYRLIRMDDLKHVNFLDVDNSLPEKEVMWFFEDKNKSMKCSPDSLIKFYNESENDVYITIQRDEIDDEILRPAELFNFQEFRDLFPDERLADGLSIDVGVQNILFVDIVGSSAMFKNLGDKEAFALVRYFYGRAHEIVMRNNGVIVKTIGDEVMCAFSRGIDALKAGFAFNVELGKTKVDYDINVRVSIHRGSALAVNMNTGIDYFGTPVNVAAKMQNFTNENEISLSTDFVKERHVQKYLLAKGFTFKQVNNEYVKGIGDLSFYKVKTRKKKN